MIFVINWVVFLSREYNVDTITIMADNVYLEEDNYIFTRCEQKENVEVALIPYDNVIAISRKDSFDKYEFDLLEND